MNLKIIFISLVVLYFLCETNLIIGENNNPTYLKAVKGNYTLELIATLKDSKKPAFVSIHENGRGTGNNLWVTEFNIVGPGSVEYYDLEDNYKF